MIPHNIECNDDQLDNDDYDIDNNSAYACSDNYYGNADFLKSIHLFIAMSRPPFLLKGCSNKGMKGWQEHPSFIKPCSSNFSWNRVSPMQMSRWNSQTLGRQITLLAVIMKATHVHSASFTIKIQHTTSGAIMGDYTRSESYTDKNVVALIDRMAKASKIYHLQRSLCSFKIFMTNSTASLHHKYQYNKKLTIKYNVIIISLTLLFASLTSLVSLVFLFQP